MIIECPVLSFASLLHDNLQSCYCRGLSALRSHCMVWWSLTKEPEIILRLGGYRIFGLTHQGFKSRNAKAKCYCSNQMTVDFCAQGRTQYFPNHAQDSQLLTSNQLCGVLVSLLGFEVNFVCTFVETRFFRCLWFFVLRCEQFLDSVQF